MRQTLAPGAKTTIKVVQMRGAEGGPTEATKQMAIFIVVVKR